MMAAVRRLPVVVVLGATGTGKSKLAIELGQRFNGEIISADSMQLYKGLDVITNKVTAEEQTACPHHLLSVLNPLSSSNTVVDFKKMALPIIEKLQDETKVPIIVGGTNYYIEALLWDFLIDKETAEVAKLNCETEQSTMSGDSSHAAADSGTTTHHLQTAVGQGDHVCSSRSSTLPLTQSDPQTPYPPPGGADLADDSASLSSDDSDEQTSQLEDVDGRQSSKARQEKEGKYAVFDTVHLHNLLQEVDPASAKRLHPKNRRKIVRALQVYDDFGVAMSQIHQTQHRRGNTPGLSGALRFPHCCVFWLQTQQDVLDERLDGRVEDMLNNGLMAELHDLHAHYLESVATWNGEPDYTLGIFQSIGFKEFHDYLVLPVDQRKTSEGKALFEKGIEGLKLATRQYARRQLKWIKNRFLKRAGVHVPAVYSVDSTDPSQWSSNVLQPATDILKAIIAGEKVPIEPLSPDSVPGTVHVQNVCEVCNGRVFTTLQEWEVHLGSRKHKKMLQSKRRKEKADLHKCQLPETAETNGNS